MLANIKPRSAAEKFILYAANIGALQFLPEGRQLKSGRMSPYFFNSGLFNTGESVSNLAGAYADASTRFDLDVIYGPAYKGIPLAVAVAQALGGDTGYAFNRKEVKDHGEGGLIVGAKLEGKNVLIVDDVMTTGTSSGEAVEIIRAHAGIPIGCVIAFDREERGKEGTRSAVQQFQEGYDVRVSAAATLSDLIRLLERASREGDVDAGVMLEKVLAYKNEYGCSA